MIIQHNIAALNSHRQLSINNSNTSKNLEKLSSGYRINRAADDAAGLAISEKMRGQIRGLAKAEENVSHAINLIQTAEGGLQETHAILQRMRELAVQSANGTYDNPNDRANLQLEFARLTEEIDRISYATDYNGIKLLNGTGSTTAAGTAPTFASFGAGNVGSLGGTPGLNAFLLSGDTATVTITGGTGGGAGTASLTGSFASGGTSITDTVAATITGTTGAGISTVQVTLSDSGTAGADLIFEFEVDLTQLEDGGVLTLNFAGTGANALPSTPTGTYTPAGGGAGTVTNLTFQIGANGTADQKMQLAIRDMGAFALQITDAKYDVVAGVETRGTMLINIADQNDANTAINVINNAINTVSTERANLGAAQNRLEHTMNNLGVTKENLTSAESTIRDVDMAKEMMEYTKNSILVQASQAMLAQAQSLPQGVLQLLR